jgi:flagellar basal-body rod protein FlgC
MFNILDIGATGLTAQRTRMNTIAGNVLNINTTRNEQGELSPYRRRYVEFAAGDPKDPSQPGVRVAKIAEDQAPFRKAFEPGSPDADADGYVSYPNVNLETEFVNMLEATRAYEANVTMMETTKAMINASLRLLA